MNYQEARRAVFEAFREREYERCLSLVEEFLEHATGPERDEAIAWQISVIAIGLPQKALWGLALIDEHLPRLGEHPRLLVGLLTDAINICRTLGDTERARLYEGHALHLLQKHADVDAVRTSAFRLYISLGLLYQLRNEHATAYWYAMKALQHLQSFGLDDDGDIRGWLFLVYVHHIVPDCLNLGRLPEAEEAVSKAESFVRSDTDDLFFKIARIKVLRARRQTKDALQVLETIPPLSQNTHPTAKTWYHLINALVAQDCNDLHNFHRSLATAEQTALDHQLDFLLTKIQRLQREPFGQVRMG